MKATNPKKTPKYSGRYEDLQLEGSEGKLTSKDLAGLRSEADRRNKGQSKIRK